MTVIPSQVVFHCPRCSASQVVFCLIQMSEWWDRSGRSAGRSGERTWECSGCSAWILVVTVCERGSGRASVKSLGSLSVNQIETISYEAIR